MTNHLRPSLVLLGVFSLLTGAAYPLADGLGNIMGSYTIETIDEQHGTLIDNGRARVIDFNIDLKRAD